MPLMTVSVNPLTCIDIELPRPGAAAPTADRLLDYLFAADAERTIDAFVLRYRELLSGSSVPQFAPVEPTVLQKLVGPLKQAIAGYGLGDYLGVVALCGLVAEMAAMLLWDITNAAQRPRSVRAARLLGHQTFDQLGQEKRVGVLKEMGLIDSTTKAAFSTVRTIRRDYLHYLTMGHERIKDDARKAFVATNSIMMFVIGNEFHDGQVVLRPELMAYLRQRGVVAG